MQGSKVRTLLGCVLLGCMIALGGCSKHLPGLTAATPVTLTAAQAAVVTLTLADLPSDYLLVHDQTPTNAQLAQILGQPSVADTLTQLGRTGGSYRVFTFVAPEPSVVNATVRATIEVDVFDTAQHALAWETTRQTLASGAANALNVAAPGQAHHVWLQSFQAGDIAATTTTLTDVEGNAVVAITTDFVGPNVSLADAERFAGIIDDRIQHANP